MRPYAILYSLLALFVMGAAGSEELIWSTQPMAGVAELKNGKPIDGVLFAAQQLLEEQLPDLIHRYEVSAPNRLLREMADGRPVCATLRLQHPERDEVGYFIPYLPTQPMHLLTRKSLLGAFPLDNGQVSLAKLVESRELKGIIATNRGYPTELSGVLDKGRQNGSIQAIHSSSSAGNLIAMVSHERADYTLEYPAVSQNIRQTSNLAHGLVSLPLLENHEWSPAGLYCTRSPWGKQMALRLNLAIQAIMRQPDRVLALYQPFLVPSTRETDEQWLRAYFKSRSEQVPTF